ncbi:RHS repeat protein [Salmonella enterica]|nr:RHS repeat protein [Salmonella enterica]
MGTIDDGLRGSVVYSYDRSGYLTGRSGQMYDHDRYYYDKAGNLLDNEGQGPVMNNRLPGCGRDRYGYNEWGELTTRRDQQLEWNAQGQLTRVISGNTETHYGYDALGRRIRKATYGRHTGHTARSRTDFVWEGFRLLQENVQQQGWRTYLYDAEQPYTPVASVTGRGESRQVWYYHTDVTGTPQEVTAADGTLVWAGYIRGFGENAADISNSGAYFYQPLRLPGQYFDDETGLHYNLFRYYAPECGRFVSQDPIGLRGGINLYSYAPNPLSYIDPLGLSPVSPKTVLFSQDSINAVFEDGRNVNGLIHRLINDPSYINEVEPIRKVRMRDLPANVQERLLSQEAHKDSVFSLDNRRLYTAKEAGVPKIPSRWATPEELSKINLDRRFSTSDGGKSIRTRGCG